MGKYPQILNGSEIKKGHCPRCESANVNDMSVSYTGDIITIEYHCEECDTDFTEERLETLLGQTYLEVGEPKRITIKAYKIPREL